MVLATALFALSCVEGVLMFQTEEPPSPGAVLPALRYLARHQREDGSWGEKPQTCSCPNPPVRIVSRCEPVEVEPLIRALGEDNPDRRAQAHAELRVLGQRALSYLLEGARDPDPEVRSRCAALRRDLVPFAPGGGDAEVTGLALLAFLGAGYSHYSKDVQDGICFGTVVKKALQWMTTRQKETGAFDLRDPVGDTIATLALSECFGLTASPLYKDDAQQAMDRVARRAMTEVRGMIWKGMALKSAEIAYLTVPKKAAGENLKALQHRPAGSLQRAGAGLISIFVERRKTSPCLDGLRILDPLLLDAETLYFGTCATFQFDGPEGPLWSAWKPQYRPRLYSLQSCAEDRCDRGSWNGDGFRGRLQATAFNLMNFEIYYR
jgi:hypothetical protein